MYAVIGAGPMGLATARNLQKQGLPFVGYELHDDVGGLWDIDNPHSTVYQSAHLISSKRMTEFREFPMDETVASYPHHSELKRYFRDYAERFDLRRHYRFGTRVTALEPAPAGGWHLTAENNGVSDTRHFDAVLIASGTLHTPNLPALPGRFAGQVLHASQYRRAEQFRDQRVLIVGCGNSACDMAVDAVHQAARVDLSVRRGYYFLPKFIGGRPADTLGGKLKLPRRLKQWLDARLIRLIVGRPSDYGLPDPDYRMYESHPVVNSLVLHHLGHGDIRARRDIAAIQGHTVTFTDGEQADYDMILLATGYRLDYPFIDPAHLNWRGDAPALYLNMFHPERDDLLMMGMIEAAGLGWEGRNEQAALAALYLRRVREGHPAADTLRRLKRERAGVNPDGGYRYLKLARMAYYVHKDSYRAELAARLRDLAGQG
ncbi:NAD(P)-binding domain-containing protein [Alcanivorax marinus]|uniref:NAD(P)-binding domain-containing protein n=1 Tax=Alloalcanivorax marinus TaxID=1177169 RepID=A0A9Q3UQJ8_9GAMM|nr:NAD(P)-binding domain-containing protein [Alloalcanivorax marinus]MCC4309253.1 NAD(P)-binding domain-containing protein [Alloalcanivorax marinus]